MAVKRKHSNPKIMYVLNTYQNAPWFTKNIGNFYQLIALLKIDHALYLVQYIYSFTWYTSKDLFLPRTQNFAAYTNMVQKYIFGHFRGVARCVIALRHSVRG